MATKTTVGIEVEKVLFDFFSLDRFGQSSFVGSLDEEIVSVEFLHRKNLGREVSLEGNND